VVGAAALLAHAASSNVAPATIGAIMDKTSVSFFVRLMNTISPSGFEGEAAKVWADEAKTFTKDVWRDQHGNTYARLNKGGAPRIMLAGHVDEIGVQITHIDDKGFLYFAPIGGWDPQILQGQRIHIRGKKERVMGVIGKKPIHLLKAEERDKVVKVEDLWIDIGATSKKEAEALVAIGDPGAAAVEVVALPNGRYISKAMDDKSGAFVVLEAARLLAKMKPTAEVVAVATVQEEIGLRGATTSSFALEPQVGIAVDVTFATDFPTMDGEKRRLGEIQLGKGPVLARGPNFNPVLFGLLCETAIKKKLDHQIVAEPRGTGTDANEIQLSRAGVATALVSIPNRYMHSPVEMICLDDAVKAARLIAETVMRINDKTDFTAAP
jgi:endoglucanase